MFYTTLRWNIGYMVFSQLIWSNSNHKWHKANEDLAKRIHYIFFLYVFSLIGFLNKNDYLYGNFFE